MKTFTDQQAAAAYANAGVLFGLIAPKCDSGLVTLSLHDRVFVVEWRARCLAVEAVFQKRYLAGDLLTADMARLSLWAKLFLDDMRDAR